MSDTVQGIYLQETKGHMFLCNVTQLRHLLTTDTLMFSVLLSGILQGAERPGSVYSIMPCGDI